MKLHKCSSLFPLSVCAFNWWHWSWILTQAPLWNRFIWLGSWFNYNDTSQTQKLEVCAIQIAILCLVKVWGAVLPCCTQLMLILSAPIFSISLSVKRPPWCAVEKVRHCQITGWSNDAVLHLTYNPGRFRPWPQVSVLVWDSQGLRKAQFTIFPQWWPQNGSLPLSPPESIELEFLSCPCCCQAAVWEAAQRFLVRSVRETGRRKKRRRPIFPKPNCPQQHCRFVPHPRHSHPFLTTGSFQSGSVLRK